MKKIKIPYLNLLPVLLIAFVLFKLVDTAELSVSGLFRIASDAATSFVFGLVVAYLLNPAMVFFEKLIGSSKDSEKTRRIKRGGIIAFLYLMLLGLLTIFVVSVIPTIQDGIQEITENMPVYTRHLETWITKITGKENEGLYLMLDSWVEEGSKVIYNWLKGINVSTIGTLLTSSVSSVALLIFRICFGFIISVYYLYGKEKLIRGIKKLLYVLFGESKTDKILYVSRRSNKIFQQYVIGQLLQSLILFIIGLAVLVPFRYPFAPLLAFVLAFSNMIPYFGPTMGAVPCVILVLFYDPVKAFWLIAYAVAAQFLDNSVIGPKVMSEQVGISPLLVIAGVTIGGIFGGLFGMILGVPTIAIIKLVFYDSYVEKKLKEKNINI